MLHATSIQADTPAVVTEAGYVPDSIYTEPNEAPLIAGVPVILRILETFQDQPSDVQWDMVALAHCESNQWIHRLDGELRPHANRASSARGVFQVLVGLHRKEMRDLQLDPENDEHYFRFVRILFNRDGLEPWRSSFSCLRDERGARARSTAKRLLAEAAGEFQLVHVPLLQERFTVKR
jgi:hypothetical protein